MPCGKLQMKFKFIVKFVITFVVKPLAGQQGAGSDQSDGHAALLILHMERELLYKETNLTPCKAIVTRSANRFHERPY